MGSGAGRSDSGRAHLLVCDEAGWLSGCFNQTRRHEVMPEFHAHRAARRDRARRDRRHPYRDRYGPNTVQIRPAAE